VARFYTNENIALAMADELRRMGNDVLTSREAGRANAAVPDAEVLRFAASENRVLVTHNRRDFLKLHQSRSCEHAGIVLCTFDIDSIALARRVQASIDASGEMSNQVVRVNRPPTLGG
jgi:predicted nuclease of predicted toxin-antitoxin system